MNFPGFDFDPTDLDFKHSPLLDELHKIEIASDARINTMMDRDGEVGRNLTEKFCEDLYWRAKHKHNVLINLRGDRGCGKSTFAQGIKGFNDYLRNQKGHIREIVFNRKEYMTCYKGAQAGELFIIDEDFGFQTQTGSYRLHESMMLAEQTFRIEEVSTIACSVAHTAPHLYDYDFLVYDYDEDAGVNRAVLFQKKSLTSMFIGSPAGYVLFPSLHYIDKDIERKYYAKKKEFSTAVKKGKARTLQQDYDEIADALIKKYKWDKTNKKPTNDVYNVYLRREHPEIANTEITDIIATLKTKVWELRVDGMKDDEPKEK